MDKIEQLINNDFFKKIVVITIVCGLLFLFKSMINVLLLTLIFILLTTRLTNSIKKRIDIPKPYIVIFVYAMIIALLYFLFNHFFYEITHQTTKIIEMINNFYIESDSDNALLNLIADVFNQFNLKTEIQAWANIALSYVTNIGAIGIAVFIAFLTSRFSWFWSEVAYLGKKFISTFGIVLETQFIIASINTCLTTIALYFLGFPQLPTLAIMVFILGLIPVAGVIISCFPLAFIAYAIGGFQKIIYVLIMIVIIHAIETYFLNPKLMSSRTKLPIFYVFLVLFLAEQILGVWGLIVGIPIFMFMLDLLEVKIENKPRILLRRKKSG
ncbi:AI-2E family transporter [Erysipelotrichaceae bacterium OttesenSCG-928-M19]|nr:AI-2E family transporter [Erysipelotrichaceae bacterium OttesenSCG-928-M19]